jgi:hypothetical protein
MPGKPKRPCRRCGRLLYVGAGSLPEPMCHPCRRAAPQRSGPRPPRYCGCGTRLAGRSNKCPDCRGARPTTSERGYGLAHQKARRAAIAAYNPGDPCARCGMPMTDDPSLLHLDHTDDRSGYLGLSHMMCNISSNSTHPPRRREPRVCDQCGLTFKPGGDEQWLCSRPCRTAARQAAPKPAPKPKRVAEHGTKTMYCYGCCCDVCWEWYVGWYSTQRKSSTPYRPKRLRYDRVERDAA